MAAPGRRIFYWHSGSNPFLFEPIKDAPPKIPRAFDGLTLAIFALWIVVTFALYWPCRGGTFIWDDQFLVNKNLFIRSPLLIVEAFRHFLAEDPVSNFYRPVQTVTYIFDYWRGGLDPAIYRQTNYIIHGLNGGLIFVFLSLVLKRKSQIPPRTIRASAILVSLIWLVHPIHSATVAYISGRADSLALIFLLLGWCSWEKRRDAGGFALCGWTLAAAAFGLLAMCSKEAALIAIGFFLLSEGILKKDTSRKERWLITFGCVFLGIIYFLLRQLASTRSEPSNLPPTWLDRPNLVLRAMGDYLRLLIFPANLRMERQVVQSSYLYADPAAFDPIYPFLALLGAIFLGTLVFSFLKKGEFRAIRRFGVMWFVLTILPVSNVFALNATVAEHWLYIPSVGFLITLLGWCLEASRKVQVIAACLCCFAVTGLSLRTFSRAGDWTDAITFFKATIRDGGDTPRMRVNLADEYRLQGKLKEGELILREVLRRSPKYSQARHSLMVNLRAQGRTEEAEKLVPAGEEPFGDSFRGKLYAADYFLRRGDLKTCADKLKQLRQLYPDSWLLTLEMGMLVEKLGRPDERLHLIESFAANHWWHLAAHSELANIYAADPTRYSDAVKMLVAMSQLDIHDVTALNRAGEILVQHRSFHEAMLLQQKVIKRDPSPFHQARLAALKKAASVEK